MTWWRHWKRKLVEAEEAVKAAEGLRDRAETQRKVAEEDIAPRVDAVTLRLRQLRSDNHFGPMIDSILRGTK